MKMFKSVTRMGWYDSVMVRGGWYFMADFWGDIKEYFRESEEPSKSQELSRVVSIKV